MAVTLAVTWRARPGSEAAIEATLRTMVELSNQEPGCLHFSAHRSTTDPTEYFIFEQYRDQAALDEHSNSQYFKQHVLEEAVPLLEERVRRYYEPLA
jgi:quinol monooxygenase YgiN